MHESRTAVKSQSIFYARILTQLRRLASSTCIIQLKNKIFSKKDDGIGEAQYCEVNCVSYVTRHWTMKIESMTPVGVS